MTTTIPPTWTGPDIECWTCGRTLRPVVTTPLSYRFWTIPTHAAFAIPYPLDLSMRISPCGGGGRLIGPVL